MKLKYYLKGLGIGMIISAALLGALFYFGEGEASMTDAEVIERARQLGMVEDTAYDEEIFEAVDIPDEIPDETVSEEGTQVSEEIDEGESDTNPEDAEVVEGTWSNADAEEGETPPEEEGE